MKIIQYCTGFSLIEVLIALGLVGGISFALMKVTSSGISSSQTVQSYYDLNSINSELKSYILDTGTCSENFKGFDPNQKTELINLKHKYNGTEVEKYKVSSVLGKDLELKSLSFGGDVKSFSPNGRISQTDLKIVIDRKREGGIRSSIQKVLSIFFTLDESGKIASCSSQPDIIVTSEVGGVLTKEYLLDCTKWEDGLWSSQDACLQDGRVHKIYAHDQKSDKDLENLRKAIDSGASISISWTPLNEIANRRTVQCQRASFLYSKNQIKCNGTGSNDAENISVPVLYSTWFIPFSFKSNIEVKRKDENGADHNLSHDPAQTKYSIFARY